MLAGTIFGAGRQRSATSPQQARQVYEPTAIIHKCGGMECKETDPLLKNEGCAPAEHGLIWKLSKALGVNFLLAMFMIKHLFLALVLNLTGPATPYIYRRYGVPGPQMQIYNTATCFPLAMQPILSLVSDCIPIRGLNKTPYMIMAALIGAPAFLAVGTLSREVLGVTGLVLCLLMIKIQLSTCNVLSDARYMMKISEKPAQGPELVTFMKMGTLILGFVGTILSGLVVQRAGPTATYSFAFPLAAMVLIPLSLGWLGEPRRTEEDTLRMRERLNEQREICILALVVCGGALLLTIVGIIFRDAFLCTIVAACVVIILLVSYAFMMKPIVANFLIYTLITNALDVSASGASYYFYTDTEQQFPEGPHFSVFFYVSAMHAVSIIFGILGTIWYLNYLRSWTYRGLIGLTVVFKAGCRGMDALFFSLESRKMGIPDSVLVLTEDVLEPVLDAWRGMPVAILLANVCPKGMEGTMNGLNASAIYIGQSAAKCFGALLLQFLECRPGGNVHESHEFKNLWIASVVSMVLSVAAGIGLIWLIPDARQDVLLSEIQESSSRSQSNPSV